MRRSTSACIRSHSAVAVRPDDHRAPHRTVVGQLGLGHHVLVPAGEVVGLRGERRAAWPWRRSDGYRPRRAVHGARRRRPASNGAQRAVHSSASSQPARLRMSSTFCSLALASSPCSSSSAARSFSASAGRAVVGVGRARPRRRRSAMQLGPLDERVDHLVLGHDLDHLALDEQVARACGRRRCRGRPPGPRPGR